MGTPADVHPDLILHGGRIYTVDAGDRVVEALAIRGGRIVAVGSTDEIRRLAGPATWRVPGPARRRISSVPPTATMCPPRMASASTTRSPASTV